MPDADMQKKYMHPTPNATEGRGDREFAGQNFFSSKAGKELIKNAGIKIAKGVVPDKDIKRGYTTVHKNSIHREPSA